MCYYLCKVQILIVIIIIALYKRLLAGFLKGLKGCLARDTRFNHFNHLQRFDTRFRDA